MTGLIAFGWAATAAGALALAMNLATWRLQRRRRGAHATVRRQRRQLAEQAALIRRHEGVRMLERVNRLQAREAMRRQRIEIETLRHSEQVHGTALDDACAENAALLREIHQLRDAAALARPSRRSRPPARDNVVALPARKQA